jgi:hypothetical protein
MRKLKGDFYLILLVIRKVYTQERRLARAIGWAQGKLGLRAGGYMKSTYNRFMV